MLQAMNRYRDVVFFVGRCNSRISELPWLEMRFGAGFLRAKDWSRGEPERTE
jgi:hypothetical protein